MSSQLLHDFGRNRLRLLGSKLGSSTGKQGGKTTTTGGELGKHAGFGRSQQLIHDAGLLIAVGVVEQAAQHLSEVGSAVGAEGGGQSVGKSAAGCGLRHLVEVLMHLWVHLS